MSLIAANVLAAILGTVDAVARAAGGFLEGFEAFSVAVFTVEYGARVWSAVEDHRYAEPIRGRLRFVRRPLLVVDLLAIAPFYLAVLGIGVDLRFLRALRLVRVVRLLKLARYTSAVHRVAAVFRERKEKLVVAVVANGLLLVVASSLMYHLERAGDSDAFGSVPDAMWWGIATLARLPPPVGYEGPVPETVAGQAAGAVVAVLGIGLFALPASILAGGFMEATDRGNEMHARPSAAECPYCGERL